MKTIGIDCRFADAQGGLGRYTRSLVSAILQTNPDIHFRLFVLDAGASWLSKLPGNAFDVIAAPFRPYSLAEQIRFPSVLRAAKCDLLFFPHFNVPLLASQPFVVTVHDLILHRFPNRASLVKRMAYRLLMRRAVSRARKVIVVSDFTGTELRAMFGDACSRKLCVIPQGVDPVFRAVENDKAQSVLDRLTLRRQFFLYVGNAKQHKNVPALIHAFQKSKRDDCDLVLVWGGKEAEGLEAPSCVRRITGLGDEDLAALYSSALAFVTTSLYEGFCLPAAEAQACGCPVIALKNSALPEVVEHGVLVETLEEFSKALVSPPSHFIAGKVRGWGEVAKETLQMMRD